MTLPVIPYASNIILDFNASQMEVTTLTGNVTFSSAHVRINSQKVLKITASGADRTLVFPASWVFVGGAAPTTIASGKTALLSLYCFGDTDSDIIAAYAVQS